MSPLIGCVILLVVSLVLLLFELLIPTGGVLGILAGAGFVTALVLAFQQGPAVGLVAVAAIGVFAPIVIALATRIWPHTPLGKHIMQTAMTPEEVLGHQEDLSWLIGSVAQAASRLLPSGVVQVAGRTFDATAIGEAVDAGDWVTIVRAEGGRLVVRKTKPDLVAGGVGNKRHGQEVPATSSMSNNTDFDNTDFDNADLSNADPDNSDLESADLESADFESLDLSDLDDV